MPSSRRKIAPRGRMPGSRCPSLRPASVLLSWATHSQPGSGPMTDSNADNKWIGKRTPRPDGADKVTGRAAYAADTTMPGMIWGKVLRSPHPHARIRSINTAKAEKYPGVMAVVTAKDVVDFPIAKGPVMLRIQA